MTYEQKLCLGYQEALTQLRKHPELIWTRNNFFLLVQTGLLAFTINIENQPYVKNRAMPCAVGFLLALIWAWVNWAGRRLQKQWRKIVEKYEEKIFDKQDGPQEVMGPFHRTIEGKKKRYSITLALEILSIGFMILWIVLLFLPKLG